MAAEDCANEYIFMSGDGRSSSRIPPSEERVKNVAEKIKKITQDTVDEENLRHVVFETCALGLAASRESKLLKPLIKALDHLEKVSDVSRSVFRDTLTANHLVCQDDDRRLSLEYLQFWSQLIEGTEVGKDVVGQYFMDRYLDAVFTIKDLVKGHLRSRIASNKWTGKHTAADKSSENNVARLSTDNQSHLHACIKFLIQLYQNFRSDISRRINSTTNDIPDVDMTDAKQLLVSLLKCPTIPKDCVFLAATCLSFHLTYHYNKAATMQEFLDIYVMFNMLELKDGEQSDIIRSSDSRYLTQFVLLMSTHSSDILARISLINGMLACTESAHLWQIVSGSDRETQDNAQGATKGQDTGSVSMTLFEWLFHETVDLCRSGEWQFHAFSLLQLWYSKAAKYAEKHLEHNGDLFGQGCGVFKATLDLVWTQMDSPVDGVTECITQVYKMALALHVNASSDNKDVSAESDCKETLSGIILNEILDKALQMSWHVKSKHALVSGLIPYVPMSYILKKERHLGAGLLDCMSTNFLAPSATQVFTAVLRNADLTDSSLRDEINCWIHKGLMCGESLRKHNVNHLWLPACIKFAPHLFHCLLKQTEESVSDSEGKDKDSQLYMFTCLLKSARMHHVRLELPVEMLRLVLQHADDDLRLDGFALTCVTPKKSEPLNEAEISLLQTGLPYNMNNDNAPFRQKLQSHLRTALVRARDSAISALKDSDTKGNELVERTLEFLEWFWRLCIDNLHPGASYQRLKTSLDWITAIVDTLTYQPGKHQKKGYTPQKVTKLLEAAAERQLLMFYTDEVVRSLLSCLLHGTDEIRECAGEVLHTYMPWPLPLEEYSSSSSDRDDVTDANLTMQEHSVSGEDVSEDAESGTTMGNTCSLLTSALNLCDNPKAYESEAGALLVKLVFSRLVVDRDSCFQMMRSVSGKHNVKFVKSSIANGQLSTLHFIGQLVSLLKQSLHVAKSHVIQAATTSPGHGLVLAIQRCLSECRFEFTAKSEWRKCIRDLVDVSIDLLRTVLNVLGSSLDGEGVAPSFEEMGLSVQRAIADCAGDDESFVPGAETILTSQQQLVMTWCWVNTRQVNILLGCLADRVPLGNQGLLDVGEVRRMAQIFVGVLTRCRHRGAIEGSNVGFMKFCTTLLNCKEEELRQIPGALLKEVLDKVRCAGSDASITRRSAGLPLIVQSIVASEGKIKQHVLLKKAINELLTILSDPIPDNQDQTKDLPHVHTLNILKAVFREASIAGNAQPYVASTAIHAIDGFASPIWAVQNGAMQLFSTLLQRMLGQKKTKEDHLNTMTPQEFFVHYPVLQPYLSQQLTSAVKSLQDNKLHLNPTLYPVLTILSKLSAGITQFDALDVLRDMVLDLASSAILAVRELAAAALPALIPKQDLLNYVIHLASQLPENREMCLNYNALHGTLLQIDRLMCHVSLEGTRNDLEVVADLIYIRTWIASKSNKCYITRAAYIKVLQKVHQKSGVPFTKELIMILYLELQMTSQETPSGMCRVGFDQYLRQLVKWRLEIDTEALKAVENVLQSSDWDLGLTCLKHMKYTLKEGLNELVGVPEDWVAVQNLLFKMVQRKDLPWELLCEAFECLIAISQLRGACSQSTTESGTPNFDALWERMNFLFEKERNSRHAGYAVAVMGILLCGRLSNGGVSTHVKQFCDVLHSCSDPVCSEHMRGNCALSLVFVGAEMLEFLHRKQQQRPDRKDNWYDSCVLKLAEATELLLMDENSDIRSTTARFVVSVPDASQCGFNQTKETTPVIHPNVALVRLKSWSKFCDKLSLVDILFHSLKSEETAAEIIMRESKVCVDDLFAPEEVNPYKERAILHALRTCYEGITDETERKDVSGAIEKQSKEIYKELEEASQLLCSLCVSALNITCNKWVFDALWSITQRCKICLKVTTDNENRTIVLSIVQKLREIPLVHPKLQVEINNLCSSYQ